MAVIGQVQSTKNPEDEQGEELFLQCNESHFIVSSYLSKSTTLYGISNTRLSPTFVNVGLYLTGQIQIHITP